MALEREFTPAEIQQMRAAGVPADRVGLGSEYPKMLYRKTDREDKQIQTDAASKCGETWLVINRFEGLLCETMIVHGPDEAEIASEEGWEDTPRAAHGLSSGLAARTSAKDDEIARLKAELEAAKSEPKRGPGRPPKVEPEPA